jgi:hypothetical protein
VSGSVRRAAMVGVVTLVLLWPAAHLALVARDGIDPWELFGWAMYSQPAARVQVRVDVERAGALEPLRAMGTMRRQVEAFARSRTTLGRLASPDELLATVFASDASIDAIELVLRDVKLDHESALLIGNDDRMRFARPRMGR